jgi:hypothetical protein
MDEKSIRTTWKSQQQHGTPKREQLFDEKQM